MKKKSLEVGGVIASILLLTLAGHRANGEKQMSTHTINTEHTNRLINETSPYLLQHANNPVDWYAWGDEAFEAAKKLNRPIFLSIGYSTCHWCHVMAHESFSSEHIAKIMNDHFISFKVDREDRPDVDAVYMNAVQAMTGGGGWPLSVFLTPGGKPFYGGTYYPPTDKYGRPGFDKILVSIADAWDTRQEEITESADKMTQFLAGAKATSQQEKLTPAMLESTFTFFARTFDKTNGGFGTAPKFPQPSNLSMLMTYWRRSGNQQALEMVTTTLDKMATGGIHDHLGGGFHRYSVDAVWLVPHFEKMLYDQALLSRAYLQAFQITDDEEYSQIARDIFDYILRDMTDSEGGFYSAEDADSEGKEGTFYLWTPKEINALLSKEQAKVFSDYYGVEEKGNFEEESTILSVKMTIDDLAKKHNISTDMAKQLLEKSRRILFSTREKRIRPHRDEKIITGWNGLMISSFAMGGRILEEEKYTRAAQRSAEFVLSNLRTKGRLRRFFGKGKAVGLAYLDDYAFLIRGLIDLYETDFDPKWLIEAKALADRMIELFEDTEKGGFFMTGSDSEDLIVRTKPSWDGAVPSANSIAALALLRLGQITMNNQYIDQAKKTLGAFSIQLEQSGASLTEMLMAVDFYLGPRQEIVIAGNPGDAKTKQITKLVGSKFLPTAVTMLHLSGQGGKEIEKIVPFIENQIMINNQATVYVCENYICKQPINDIDKLNKILSSIEKPVKENDNASDSAIDK